MKKYMALAVLALLVYSGLLSAQTVLVSNRGLFPRRTVVVSPGISSALFVPSSTVFSSSALYGASAVQFAPTGGCSYGTGAAAVCTPGIGAAVFSQPLRIVQPRAFGLGFGLGF